MRWGFDWVSLDVWVSDHSVLHLVSSKGSLWLVFLGHLAFSDEFGQGLEYSCARQEG